MSPIKLNELSFDHIVEFSQDNTVFATAKESESGHLRIFLIVQSTGNVYARNGRVESWEQLDGYLKEEILTRIYVARQNKIPTYRINGSRPQ